MNYDTATGGGVGKGKGGGMKSRWREYARPIIAQVLKETDGQSEQEIRKALQDAYPFYERAMHPYKIWCDEVQIQRGFKPKSAALRYEERWEEESQMGDLFEEVTA